MSFVGDADATLAELGRRPAAQVMDERRDLVTPFAKRRQRERDDVQAVEEVFAEASLGDQLFEVGSWWRRRSGR